MKKYYIIIFESVIILCSENKEEYDSMMAELKVKYANRSSYEYQQIELLNGKITFLKKREFKNENTTTSR